MQASSAGSWKLENITPQKAQQYLTMMGPNRNLRESRVSHYASQMAAGRWLTSHQGIAFNCDGTLKDGQHRLTAIVRSGVPVRMWVYRGLPNDAMLTIDTHIIRADHDAFTIIGRHTSTAEVACAKRMIAGFNCSLKGSNLYDRAVLFDFLTRHSEAIEYAVSSTSSHKGIRHASVSSVIARAWYSVDRERLEQFCQVLREGVANNRGDSAAVKLRLYIAEGGASGGNHPRVILYRKAEAALKAFIERRQLSKLYEVSEELYPLPEESAK